MSNKAAVLIQRSFRAYYSTLPQDNLSKLRRYITNHRDYIKQRARELEIIWRLYDEGGYPGYAIEKDTRRIKKLIRQRTAQLVKDQRQLDEVTPQLA